MQNKKILIVYILIIYINIFNIFNNILACTGIRIKTNNNAIIYARTLEFALDLESEILFVPKNYKFSGTGPKGLSNGLQWKSKYAVVGINALHATHFLDGINEKGLASGLFYFPYYAEYQKISSHEISKSIASWELVTWILTNFATVKEVKDNIKKIKVSNVALTKLHATQPLHFIVHDAKGNCIVIEFVKGILNIHDNKLGVITNAPQFDWHITNLSNYINLKNTNTSEIKLGEISVKPMGEGTGMLGLPGDFTSPSRFIRAAVFNSSVIPSLTEDIGVQTAFHILNSFDIPKGIICAKEVGNCIFECTQWTSAADLKNRKYYFHTYNNRQIQMIDLSKIKHVKRVLNITMNNKQVILDITPRT